MRALPALLRAETLATYHVDNRRQSHVGESEVTQCSTTYRGEKRPDFLPIELSCSCSKPVKQTRCPRHIYTIWRHMETSGTPMIRCDIALCTANYFPAHMRPWHIEYVVGRAL